LVKEKDMAKDKEKREHLNTKLLLRRIFAVSRTLHLPIELREMLLALYCHSNTFLEADDVRSGQLYFSSTASQDQLAAFCDLSDAKGAYRRLVRLEEAGVVQWTRGSKGKTTPNEYNVQLDLTLIPGVQEPGEELFPDTLVTRDLPVLNRASGSLNRASQTLNRASEGPIPGVQEPDTAFSATRSVTACPALREQEHSFADTFGETPSGRPGEPGPVAISTPNIPARVSQLPASLQGTSSPEPPTEASRLETPGIDLGVTREIPLPAPVRHKFPKGNDYMAQCSECGLDRIDARGKDEFCTPVGVSQ
jgi:hypothetical protein